MSELRQPIKPQGGSFVRYMMAQTIQGKMQSYHKRHGEAELLGLVCPLTMGRRNCRKRPSQGLQGMSRSLVPEGCQKHNLATSSCQVMAYALKDPWHI